MDAEGTVEAEEGEEGEEEGGADGAANAREVDRRRRSPVVSLVRYMACEGGREREGGRAGNFEGVKRDLGNGFVGQFDLRCGDPDCLFRMMGNEDLQLK